MSEFRPFPLLGNTHLQTLIGSVLGGTEPTGRTRRHLVPLPDGDCVVLHDNHADSWQPGDPMAILVHGLSGSHRSGYVQRVARQLLDHGWRVGRLDLRGAGSGEHLARKMYNAASSADLRAACELLCSLAPTSPLTLVGFSLGGNIVLKLAGEAANHPVPNLVSVAAVAPPIEPARCSALLGEPRNRFYDQHFVQCLVAQVRRQRRNFPELPRLRFPRNLTVRAFDDFYTAPNGGYANAADYYQRAASAPLIPHLRVPTYLLTARDDPFVAVDMFERLRPPPHVRIEISARGGHLGFLGWDGKRVIRWAERRLVEQLLNRG